MKFRKNGVKREHSVLPRVGAALDQIGQSGLAGGVIPGPIRKIPPHPDRPVLRFQYATPTGGKYLGYGQGAVQEVFIVSADLDLLHARFAHLIETRRDPDPPDPPPAAHGRRSPPRRPRPGPRSGG